MSAVVIFKKNIKNRHKRYIACDDVVEMKMINPKPYQALIM
mgnify:CR=1 FL=1